MSVGRRETLRRVLSICVKELCDELVNKLRNKRKRQWVREWIRRRDRLGASATLLKELARVVKNGITINKEGGYTMEGSNFLPYQTGDSFEVYGEWRQPEITAIPF
ncbi:hypothetical protein J6590_087459 [Homalodisca vitripennis]|nr:hypothetical protein J6590_087459 [Homalodisca vitripennis]